jgi:hypothetical protein
MDRIARLDARRDDDAVDELGSLRHAAFASLAESAFVSCSSAAAERELQDARRVAPRA